QVRRLPVIRAWKGGIIIGQEGLSEAIGVDPLHSPFVKLPLDHSLHERGTNFPLRLIARLILGQCYVCVDKPAKYYPHGTGQHGPLARRRPHWAQEMSGGLPPLRFCGRHFYGQHQTWACNVINPPV
ncbi:hypothetical protein NGA_2084820, partial [Nannochloropsis gaditana CCMP526]|uniref:uncharacterized protein n=1 Tax=Nannochloropsis gaditana (strain CCMP526) TaxID=1093141 RepID=UPI00029F6CE5